MRLGSEAQDDTLVFGSIRSMAVSSVGNLVVGDWDGSNVYVFSSDGTLAGHLGGKGEAPGEVQWLGRVTVGPSDSVFVYDWQLRRISCFDPETFRFVRSVSVGENEGQTPYDLIGATTDAFVVRYSPVTDLSARPDPAEVRTAPVLLVSRGGDPVDSLTGLRLASPIFAPDGSRILSRPFSRSSKAVLGPGGILYSGWNETVHIELTWPDGQPGGEIFVLHDALPVSQEEMEEVLEAQDAEGRRLIMNAELATTWPAYTTFVIDDTGLAWVKMSHEQGATLTNWLVIDSATGVVGEMEQPVGLTLMAIRAGRAYGEIRDPVTGAPLVVGYEIEKL